MCVFAIRVCVSCSIALKLAVVAGGIGGQVIAGLTAPVLGLAESYTSISAFSFVDDGHFLIIVLIHFQFLPDLIRCRLTFKFKLIITILNCSSNMDIGTIITRVGLSPLGLKWGGGVSPLRKLAVQPIFDSIIAEPRLTT